MQILWFFVRKTFSRSGTVILLFFTAATPDSKYNASHLTENTTYLVQARAISGIKPDLLPLEIFAVSNWTEGITVTTDASMQFYMISFYYNDQYYKQLNYHFD